MKCKGVGSLIQTLRGFCQALEEDTSWYEEEERVLGVRMPFDACRCIITQLTDTGLEAAQQRALHRVRQQRALHRVRSALPVHNAACIRDLTDIWFWRRQQAWAGGRLNSWLHSLSPSRSLSCREFLTPCFLRLGQVEGGGQGISNKAIMQGLPNSITWNLFLGRGKGGGERWKDHVASRFLMLRCIY